MTYVIVYTRQAEIELLAFPGKIQQQIASKIARLQRGFTGDIKKLQAADTVYRLRSGSYRILFELDDATIIIRTIRDRKKTYD